MSGLAVEGLCFRDLGPLELSVAPGECLAIEGASGAGKTLLLRALADLDPHRGRVCLDGAEQASLPAPVWRRRVGLLRPESRWWHETVGEHFPAGAPDGLERLGFSAAVLHQTVSKLSSGERQRLALLRLLAGLPGALLLDEPTAHLDRDATAAVESLLADYGRERPAPVVWVTHDPAQAARVATRSLRLEGGVLVEPGGL